MGSTWDPDATVVPASQPAAAPGSALLVGRYRVGKLIGRGGAGQVHRARDELTGRDVAVKFVRALSEGTARQLRRELIVLRLLELPGVVRLLDDGLEEDQHFLVMELLEGGPFDGLAGPWERWREAALTLLEALGRVHFAGVVHRDLKPGNILLDADGRPVLTDFGLAQGHAVEEHRPGWLEGTPRYMAPEQRRGEPCDARTDLYALGVMFRGMLEGTDVPPEVARMVSAMCAPDPTDRPESALAVVEALDGAARTRLAALDDLPEVADIEALRALFDEPEVTFLHLAEDAAAILHRRTAGRRERVGAELQRWVRAGRCHAAGDRMAISRAAIEALWAEDDPLRPERALERARQLHARGATGQALAILEAIAEPGEGEVSALVVDLALGRQRVQETRRAVWLAQRHRWSTALALLQAAHVALHVDPRRGLELLGDLPAPADPRLAGWRLAVAIHAASRVAPDEVPRWIDEARRWAGSDTARLARLATWRARVAYAAGRYGEALALDQLSAMGAETRAARVLRLTTAAAAALEVPGAPGVEDLTAEAIRLARELRHPVAEARAVWIRRTAAYRSGTPLDPEPALVEAARAVSPAVAAQLAMTEAAAAWRTGHLQLGAALALEGAHTFRALSFGDGDVLGRALATACGAAGVAPAADEVAACQPEIALQAAALCALAGHPVPCPIDPRPFAGRSLDVLGGDECARALGQGPHGDSAPV